MSRGLKRHRSGGDQFGKRLERAAVAGAENGALQAVYWLAGVAVLIGIGWFANQLRNT